MGQIITFYSYKGGVGRSMAMANVAVLLSSWGFKTLMIDWDLEAPGLENFFREHADVPAISDKNGILEYLTAAQQNGKKIDWQDYVTAIKTPLSREPIHLMPAGKRDADYFKKLRAFDISKFYDEHEGGKVVEALRNALKSEYDFVLVDSRTGVTDVGGICTIQMPDMLVLLFTPTEQGLKGIKFIADSAREGQQNLPVARKRLKILPVPTRIDSNTEFKISQEWTERFARELAHYYADWLPAGVSPAKFIEHTKLPYVPYFSYGEKLPVIEQGMDDKGGLGYAFENLAALIASGLEDTLRFLNERDGFVRSYQKQYNFKLETVEINLSAEDVQMEITNAPFLIYVSKVPSDDDVVMPIVDGLRKLQGKYEIGVWDDSMILPGDEWDSEIKKHLSASDIVLFFVSENSLFNTYFNEVEVKMALHSKPVKRIIPIYLDSIRPLEGTPLTSFHGIVYAGNPNEVVQQVDRLLANLRRPSSIPFATLS
ncbi:MAG: TIR domain-containing protein [Saprospiraceae bacterium]